MSLNAASWIHRLHPYSVFLSLLDLQPHFSNGVINPTQLFPVRRAHVTPAPSLSRVIHTQVYVLTEDDDEEEGGRGTGRGISRIHSEEEEERPFPGKDDVMCERSGPRGPNIETQSGSKHRATL